MEQWKADILMLLITIGWGSSYMFMRMGLDSLEAFNLIALRFGIAFILTAVLFHKRFRKTNWKTVQYSALLGLILFGVFASLLMGLETTSTSNAGFLVSLTVIFVPMLYGIIYKEKPKPKLIVGLCLVLGGIGLLTMNEGFTIRPGDFLCVLAALFYATHILVTNAATKVADTLNLGILQLGFTALYGLVFSLLLEKPTFPDSPSTWIAVLALSIICSAFGFVVQPIAQKYTTPTKTGLIFSLEPVFAALFGFVFMHEILSLKGYAGALIVFVGVIIAEWQINPRELWHQLKGFIRKAPEKIGQMK